MYKCRVIYHKNPNVHKSNKLCIFIFDTTQDAHNIHSSKRGKGSNPCSICSNWVGKGMYILGIFGPGEREDIIHFCDKKYLI